MESLFDVLSAGTTLVTANQRLARSLHQAYAQRQQNAGLVAWATPDILPWGAWLRRCWTEAAARPAASDFPVLLTPVQEAALWEMVIRASAGGDALLQPQAAARSAREAWQLAHAWHLELASGGAGSAQWLNEDARAFLDWSRAFRERCATAGWLDTARLATTLNAHWQRGELAAPSALCLAGFDELTPQQTALLDVLRARGCAVQLIASDAEAGEVVRTHLPGATQELAAAARWARRLLEGNPELRIGVVVPELNALRAEVERIFEDVFMPAAVLPGPLRVEQWHQQRAYNISASPALTSYPVVSAVWLILELGLGPRPVERFGALLRSPFVGGAQSEAGARARLDAWLRRIGDVTLSARSLSRSLAGADGGRGAPPACPALAEQLSRWMAVFDAMPKRQAPSAWAEALPRLLGALGWPGERVLDSLEYQTQQAFRDLLTELSGLDGLYGVIGYGQAVQLLRRLANDASFQPETADVPVQVLGTLEAAGLSFDHLWVTGLHDEAWPPPARPNPLLPLALQRRHGIPHASPERELAFARRITARLCASAPRVVLSYPASDGDRALRPSPLLRGFDEQPAELLAGGPQETLAGRMLGTATLESLQDEQAPPVTGTVRGGTAIFKYQAACPFRAYAEHRLGAVALDHVELGLDARARGILLHLALQYLWDDLADHATLTSLDAAAQAAAVSAAVARAIGVLARQRPQTFTARFTAIEQARLEQLLGVWLALERERPPFRVARQEQDQVLSLGGIETRLKIDRIDALPDGGVAIIDYKTGVSNERDWLGERPEEPQLPLYALSQAQEVAAVLFAQLRPGELRFRGLARSQELIPGIKAFAESRHGTDYGSWDALLAHWRTVLTRLAEAFHAGVAAVDPKDYPQTCRYCHLGTLCRIGEQHVFGPQDAAAEGEDV